MSADLIGDDACREAFNKARQQRFSVHGLDVVCEPDIFRAGYAAGRDSEIAKRDARIVELEHRCGVYGLELHNATERLQQAERQIKAIKAQEPVACIQVTREFLEEIANSLDYDVRDVRDKVRSLLAAPVSEAKRSAAELFSDVLMCQRNQAETLAGDPYMVGLHNGMSMMIANFDNSTDFECLSVAEAKAQGVVKWPEADEIMQMAFEEGQPADDASGYCFELEEFDLFIERLMSDVARLNAAPVQHPKCKTCDDNGRIGGPSFYAPDEGGEPCPDCCAPVKQVSVPECFAKLLHHAHGMTMGADWNKGTMAGYHREPLGEAVVQCQAWLAAAPAASAPSNGEQVRQVAPDGKIAVSGEALRTVLNALVNAPYQIRELQVTREPVALFADNPINVLIAEYEAAHAYPAAPAADAGLVDMYRHLQTVTPYRFKKIQDASVTDGGDVLYFHKDRFDAALLDDMAANCAKESK